MSADRDLAEAIHHEIISPASIKAALDQWQASSELQRNDHARMWSVIAGAASRAIDAVLARRQSEAARTGRDPTNPFAPTEQFERGDYEEEDGYPGSLVRRKRGTP